MEARIEAACSRREISGLVMMASDKTGKFEYSRAFGPRSLLQFQEQMTPDTPAWIASFTKLMTTIAVLQCVENDKLSLETDVSSILWELKDLKLLDGFDESGEPVLREKKEVITVKHLLTHTSGMSYDFFHPLLQRWRNMKGETISGGPTIVQLFKYPIVFEPGTSWEYSSALDGAGRMVERVNGNQSLTKYLLANVLKPLGITDVTFHIEAQQEMQKRAADMSMRDPKQDNKMNYMENELTKDESIDDMGGGGAFASPADFMKILRTLLANDGKVLRPDTVDQMFKSQLNEASQKALMEKLRIRAINAIYGALPPQVEKNWTFAGLMNCDDIQDRRRAGSVSWIGLPNMTWWIDRAAGLCGLFAPQCLPPGDAQCIQFSQDFECEMYHRFSMARSSL